MQPFVDGCRPRESDRLYLENKSRRNNLKISGITEKEHFFETWEGTQQLVKEAMEDKLKIPTEIQIDVLTELANVVMEGVLRGVAGDRCLVTTEKRMDLGQLL